MIKVPIIIRNIFHWERPNIIYQYQIYLKLTRELSFITFSGNRASDFKP